MTRLFYKNSFGSQRFVYSILRASKEPMPSNWISSANLLPLIWPALEGLVYRTMLCGLLQVNLQAYNLSFLHDLLLNL